MEEPMRYAIPTLLFALAAFAPASSRSESWAVYHDSIHDCRLEYSSALFTRDPFDSTKESQRFSGPNTQTFFRISGMDNKEHLTPNDLKTKYLEADAPGDIVYERTKPEFLVLSGYRGDSIFYIKAAVSPDNRTICVLEIFYPRNAKRAFDNVVTRMSRSFVVEHQS
jgi:hypothetical protein